MEGQGDRTLGHVSARHPGSSCYWMKAAGLGLEEVTPDDVLLLDMEGQKLWGRGSPHRELSLHVEIYRARPDVMAVVHTHPLHATVFSSTDLPLRPLIHEAVPFAPDVPRFRESTDLILEPQQGQAVARALGQSPAVLLRNHGLVAVGASVEEACVMALYLDKACRAQLLASGLPGYAWTPESEVERKRAHTLSQAQLKRDWEYYVRKLARQERGGHLPDGR